MKNFEKEAARVTALACGGKRGFVAPFLLSMSTIHKFLT